MDTSSQQDEDEAYADDDNPEPESIENDSNTLLANATNCHGSIPASDIHKVISSTIKREPAMTAPPPALSKAFGLMARIYLCQSPCDLLHLKSSVLQ
jgi:hypothetical protein